MCSGFRILRFCTDGGTKNVHFSTLVEVFLHTWRHATRVLCCSHDLFVSMSQFPKLKYLLVNLTSMTSVELCASCLWCPWERVCCLSTGCWMLRTVQLWCQWAQCLAVVSCWDGLHWGGLNCLVRLIWTYRKWTELLSSAEMSWLNRTT